jgi:uncharacterized protein (TIGR00369 family)
MSECHIKQPSANNCFVCGRHNEAGLHMHFYDDDHDTVCSEHTIDKRYEGYPGIVHGGILASILDEAVGRVAMVGDHHHFMMTVNMKVQYRLPIPVNTEIKVIAKAIRMKGRIGKAHGQIFLPDGTVACEAELTLADMPAEIASDSRIEELGWQVDPD